MPNRRIELPDTVAECHKVILGLHDTLDEVEFRRLSWSESSTASDASDSSMMNPMSMKHAPSTKQQPMMEPRMK